MAARSSSNDKPYQSRQSSFAMQNCVGAFAFIFLIILNPSCPHHRSLPTVIKGRGRQAWDAVGPALKAALNRLDAEAQV